MSGPPGRRGLAHRVHLVLFSGVAAAGLLMAVGLAVAVTRGDPRPVGHVDPIRTLPARLAEGSGVAMIESGLLVLIATPGLRVAVLAAGWVAAGDRRAAAIAGTVLALLGISVWLGLG